MSSSQPEPIHVLLVEDDAGDALLVQEAFDFNKVANELHRVIDGVEAMRFVRAEPPYTDAPKPVDFERFIEIVRQVDESFVSVVKLPGRP